MIKAFLFDFNDTLIRSPAWMALEIHTLPQDAFALLAEQGHIAALSDGQLARADAAFRNARETDSAAGRETAHIDGLQRMVAALGLQEQVPQQLVEQTVAALHRQCVPKVELIEGAAEMLQQLQAQGYRLSVISNAAYSPFLTWTLAHFGLINFFERVMVSADMGVRKPNPEIFRRALDSLELTAGEAVYVGDDFIKDVGGSKHVGMRAIWFRPKGDTAPLNNRVAPDATVTRLSQIAAWGRRWQTEG